MKKWSVLFLALMLLLAGCSGQASLVRDSIVASLDHTNYEYEATFKLTGDQDQLLKLAEKENDPQLLAFLKTLQAGFLLKGTQQDLNKGTFSLELNDDKQLRDAKLWSGEQKASLELIIDSGDIYVKTPLDKKYLYLSNDLNALQAEGAISSKDMKELQEKMQDLTLSFMKKYIPKFGYKLNQVKDHGKTTVKLPNGESIETTHVSITFDMKEMVQLLTYIAQDATTNPEVKNLAVEFMVLTGEIAEKNDPTLKMTPAERRAQAEIMVNLGIQSLKEWLETEGKNYTPEKVVEMAKAEGIEDLTLTFDYYIDQNKLTVKALSNFSVTVKDEAFGDKPVTFGIESDSYAWNYDKAASITLPKAADVVSYDQLAEDEKAIEAFAENGFLRAIIDFALDESDLGGVSLP